MKGIDRFVRAAQTLAPSPQRFTSTIAALIKPRSTAGEAGRRVAINLTLLLGLRQIMDLVRCHVDLHGVADAVELPVGNDDHVAAETEEATDFDSDRGDFPAALHCHAVNGSKVGPIR